GAEAAHSTKQYVASFHSASVGSADEWFASHGSGGRGHCSRPAAEAGELDRRRIVAVETSAVPQAGPDSIAQHAAIACLTRRTQPAGSDLISLSHSRITRQPSAS